MGIFDFFKKKKVVEEKPTQESVKSENNSELTDVEYLEGIYYKEEKKGLKLFRFFKNQKVLFVLVNAKLKDMPHICKWFDLDENGNSKDEDDTISQYIKDGKKISFKMTHTEGKIKGIDELEITEYNGEIIKKESISLNSYNHINKNETHGVIYKKYNEVEDYNEEEADEDVDDFYDITQTSVVVLQDGEVIAEGRIHYEIFENIWNEDEEMHERQGECSAIIIKGKRYENPSFYRKDYGFEIQWGDERELDTFNDFTEAESAYEDYVKDEIDSFKP